VIDAGIFAPLKGLPVVADQAAMLDITGGGIHVT